MNREFGVIRDFAVDDGQLDGLDLKEAFVLGYELSTIDKMLLEFEHLGEVLLVHSRNLERIKSYAEKLGKQLRVSFAHNNVSEEWCYIYW